MSQKLHKAGTEGDFYRLQIAKKSSSPGGLSGGGACFSRVLAREKYARSRTAKRNFRIVIFETE